MTDREAALPAPVTWVVKFDYRSDNGARLVGPFGSKDDATAWLTRQTFDFEANCAPVDPPTLAPDGFEQVGWYCPGGHFAPLSPGRVAKPSLRLDDPCAYGVPVYAAKPARASGEAGEQRD